VFYLVDLRFLKQEDLSRAGWSDLLECFVSGVWRVAAISSHHEYNLCRYISTSYALWRRVCGRPCQLHCAWCAARAREKWLFFMFFQHTRQLCKSLFSLIRIILTELWRRLPISNVQSEMFKVFKHWKPT